MFQCEKCEREFQFKNGLSRHIKKCKGKSICEFCKRVQERVDTQYCSRKCYLDFLENNPEYRKEITKQANEKSRELGMNGLHWCQLDNDQAKAQHKKWYTKGHEKVRELVEEGLFWSQIDKNKLEEVMKKIHTSEAHAKLSKSLVGRVFSESHRRNISKVRIEKGLARGDKNPMYGKTPKTTKGFKSGIREDIGHYTRSSWEANFARILKHEGIDYIFEKHVFEIITSEGIKNTYRPDFNVGEKFYEIKGYWYDDAKEKFTLFCQQYPEIEIEVIDSEKYYELEKHYREKIKEWEK